MKDGIWVASETAQWIKALIGKHKDLHSIPETTRRKEKTNSCKLLFVHAHISKQIHKCKKTQKVTYMT